MWKPIIRCGIVGGVIVFLWMMTAWMILPLHNRAMNKIGNESEVAKTILDEAPVNGIYVIPHYMSQESDPKNLPTSSPFIFINVKRGVNFQDMTQQMIWGLIVQIVSAGLIAYMLLKTKAMTYWKRVWFVTIVGILVALLGAFPAWNWWHYPTSWFLLESFDLIVGWFLGGLVIAKLVRK